MRGEYTRKDASATLENRSGLLEMMELEMGNDGIEWICLGQQRNGLAKEWIMMEDGRWKMEVVALLMSCARLTQPRIFSLTSGLRRQAETPSHDNGRPTESQMAASQRKGRAFRSP